MQKMVRCIETVSDTIATPINEQARGMTFINQDSTS